MFEKIKENWQKRISKNAFKSSLSYTDRKGKSYTEEVYFKRSQPPFIERFGDWGRIYPPIDENGRMNYLNFIFGGWRNFVKLLIVLAIIGFALLQFQENFNLIDTLRNECQTRIILP